MFYKKTLILLAVASCLMFLSGCNLFISLLGKNTPPVAISCNDYEMYIEERAELDGSNSYDPDGDSITYEWTISTKPSVSELNDSDILDRKKKKAYIIPDFEGEYVFNLTVSDGEDDSHDTLCIIVSSLVPEETPYPSGEPESTGLPDTTPIPTPEIHEDTPEPTPDETTDSPEPTSDITNATPNPTDAPPSEPTPPFDLSAEYYCNGNANDSSGYENHGIVYYATLTEDRDENPGNAYSFDGTGNFIDCGNGNSLNFDNGITIALWMKPGDLSSNLILSKLESETNGYMLGIYANNLIFYNNGASIVTAPIDNDKLHEWFHITVTYAANSIEFWPRIYINGALMGNSGAAASFESSTGNLYLGLSPFHTDYFTGAMDDIRIFDHVLTQENILEVMNLVYLK